uniref:Tr-type G domain-containing protein n=1 Tax=Syphacia muris TaxID=451379 RepID=A0A0N5A9U3_9BILA
MARHRNFRNIDIDYELDDEDDDYCHPFGTSLDDEIPPSPGTAQFLYRRPNFGDDILQSCNTVKQLGEHENDDLHCNNSEHTKNDWPETQFFFEEIEECSEANTDPNLIVTTLSKTPSGKKDLKNNPAVTETEVTSTKTCPTPLSTQNVKAFHPVLPEIENLRLSATDKTDGQKSSSPTMSLRPNQSSRRLSALAAAQASPTASPKLKRRAKDAKPLINFVIVGHVDAGKSTLIGHLMYMMGYVDNKTLHKYKQEASKTGKASFAFAWVLDETQEERERGVTMDIARTCFDTPHRRIIILDAPGHKDFIHNMIAGAGQADAGLLVANATRGEFETGFDQGGQTREHAMVLRSLGKRVSEIMVAVNKMDTVDWSKQRYDEVCVILKAFLCKQAGFSKVQFIPVSGLCGINLTEPPPPSNPLASWYTGPTLVQMIGLLTAELAK